MGLQYARRRAGSLARTSRRRSRCSWRTSRAGINAAPIRPTLSHGLDTLCKIETRIRNVCAEWCISATPPFPRAETCWRTPYQNLGITYRRPRSPLPRAAQVFECFRVKARHPRTGRGEPAGSAPQHPLLLRVGDRRVSNDQATRAPSAGTGITNGAKHPAVLGREGIGRERLGEKTTESSR